MQRAPSDPLLTMFAPVASGDVCIDEAGEEMYISNLGGGVDVYRLSTLEHTLEQSRSFRLGLGLSPSAPLEHVGLSLTPEFLLCSPGREGSIRAFHLLSTKEIFRIPSGVRSGECGRAFMKKERLTVCRMCCFGVFPLSSLFGVVGSEADGSMP